MDDFMGTFSFFCKILVIVIALMLIGDYCGSIIVSVDKTISPVFDKLTLDLRIASSNTQRLYVACSKPVNQDKALQTKLAFRGALGMASTDILPSRFGRAD